MSKVLYPILLIVLFIQPAQAQPQRYQCPQMSSDTRKKIISDMMRWAEEGSFRGCRPSPESPRDIDCELSQRFVMRSGTSPSYLGTPWSVLVTCFPELEPVKSINEQAIARNVDLEERKTEANRSLNQARQARDSDPMHVLTRTYHDYVVIRKCFEQRDGYALVNISAQDMERAKKAAKGIEEAIQKNNPSVDKDAAWKAANSDSEDWKTETDKVELTLLGQYNSKLQVDLSDRNRCQNILQAMETRFKRVAPEENEVKKDF
jgi:hypothetical protein